MSILVVSHTRTVPTCSRPAVKAIAATGHGEPDKDGDGWLRCEECDDRDESVNPDVEEILYDGVDQDCDPGTSDDDLDGDGVPFGQGREGKGGKG